MITDELKEKLAKIYALVNKGATEGERQAAKHQLDKIIAKYGIGEDMLADLHLKTYYFKYKTMVEKLLIMRLLNFFVPNDSKTIYYRTWNGTKAVKEVCYSLTYTDFVTIECSYEYFRRHMNVQYKKLVSPQLVKFRKAKTRNARREVLDDLFFQKYIIASGLVDQSELTTAEVNDKNIGDYLLMSGVEGGQYNKQMGRGLLIEN
jgi:hypothetical protein